LQDKNIQIRTVDQIKSSHIESYISSQLSSGKSKRSLQNEMASLRAILRTAGREKMVESERLSNKSLGLAGASRVGTNRAMTPQEFEKAHADLRNSGSHQEAAALGLMYNLGLRSKEAVRASESLKTWEKQISRDGKITVIYGTKGGRLRDVQIYDREKALSAVREAISATDPKTGRLINGAGGTLESARNRLDNQLRGVLKELNLSAHSARYAFAQSQVDHYLEEGFSKKDALAQASMDLGHGSDRYRYIGQVYDQRQE
jgi:integrase